MNIYSVLQIGDYHINHCEDFLITKKIGSNKILCAVMDGCSTAMESQFASALFGKILRQISIEKGYKELYETSQVDSLEDELKAVLKELFKEIIVLKNHLMLDEKELLTTVILLLYDMKTDKGIILSIGDGLISINGKITEFERDNKPDYLAYHLKEDFEEWYANQTQKIFFSQMKDVSIATDGISSFTTVKKINHNEKMDPVNYLLTDTENIDSEELLSLKLKKLEHYYGMKPTDDLAIIRITK
ncbi:stage II sporulation protein E (SpoIIE) [Chryseobacterium shandongense]|uniref:Stage II sporulation protein E (SpoIIE) n=1 Tax=Chryseobacterium shandongense TaxID=1493872 RepID=A0AAD1DN65_9FLAO|nr:protein phosphatase 2C domain-containing protein [Chryseobacterium shandongense]AZA88458.1 stage II sporulation protein E (SpoIIE) [Chryseobacterium shandongense]AZA97002.1 stage II sporulation protein E (SpoIIE) [Chryseobacterium shandongense]